MHIFIGDQSQEEQARDNYRAGKFCITCSQMDSNRCSRVIYTIASQEFNDEASKLTVMRKLGICIAGGQDPTDKASITCSKYNIGSSLPGL